MRTPFVVFSMLLSAMLCLPLFSHASDEAGCAGETAKWQGSYLNDTCLLHLGPFGDGTAVRFSFESRGNAFKPMEGTAAAASRDGFRLKGGGLEFALDAERETVAVVMADPNPQGKLPRTDVDGRNLSGDYKRLPPLGLRDGGLTASLRIPGGRLRAVRNADLRWAAIDADELKSAQLPLRAGLYLVQPDGEVRRFAGFPSDSGKGGLPETLAGATWDVALSPDGEAMSLVVQGKDGPAGFFFTWPDMKPLDPGHLELAALGEEGPCLLWSGRRALVRVRAGQSGSGKPAIVAYDVDTGKVLPVFEDADSCEFALKSVGNGTVTADKTCRPNSNTWILPQETVTAPLP